MTRDTRLKAWWPNGLFRTHWQLIEENPSTCVLNALTVQLTLCGQWKTYVETKFSRVKRNGICVNSELSILTMTS